MMLRQAILLAFLPATLLAQTVTVTAPIAVATEAGVYSGLFTFARTGDTSAPLTVTLSWSGSATAGQDYQALPASVTFLAGEATHDIELRPINDAIAEADNSETVVGTIQPGGGYTIGTPSSATVSITNDDTLAQTAPLLYAVDRVDAASLRLRWLDLFETETKFRVQYRAAGATNWITIDNVPANTTSYTVAGLTTGELYEFRVDAYQNSTASKTINSVIAVPVAPDQAAPPFATFEQWRVAHGLAGAWRYFAGGATQDPDGDGRCNIFEYALGSDPIAPDGPGLALAPASGGLALSWTEATGLLDLSLLLQECTTLGSWTTSPLASSFSNGEHSALDTRGGDVHFYRLQISHAAPPSSSSRIVCWGDSLTAGSGTYVNKLATRLPGCTVLNCGVGGDTSLQIADRMRGLTITSPYPYFATNTPAGTPVRIVASRTTHARIMSTSYRSSWAGYSATIANVSKVEFLNRGVKIGESSTPLTATVTSNRTNNATRLLAAGHAFTNGDVVHFPSGPLPSPLVAGKAYFVREADAGGFSLVESDVSATITTNAVTPKPTRFVSAGHPFANDDNVWFRPGATPSGFYTDRLYYVRDEDSAGFALADTPGGAAISTSYNFTGAVMGKPGLTPVALAADFSAPAIIQGPFVLDWTHPGGPTALSLRTHTDRDADTYILWIGRNNNARPHEVYADIRAAVEQIKALDARFLIVSVTNGAGESLGSPYYYGTLNLNHLLRQEFPDNFADVREGILRAASSSTQDQTDRAADIPPSSLRGDAVHFNDAGQTIIANMIAAELTRRGW